MTTKTTLFMGMVRFLCKSKYEAIADISGIPYKPLYLGR